MITPTEELNVIRAFVANKAKVLLPTEHVFQTRKIFASSQDFATRVSEAYINAYKSHYLMISYATFNDDPRKGCDDDPVVFLDYLLQLYRDSQEEKTSGSNSHDQLVSDTLTLRQGFLDDRVIQLTSSGEERIVHGALVQVGDMIKVQPCEHIRDTLGDWINFRLRVEVNS